MKASKTEETEKFMSTVRSNERVIYKICTFYVSPEYPLNDLYQEVICNLWEAWPRFRNECATSTWIYRITLNTCISGLRKLKSRPSSVPIHDVPDTLLEPDDMTDDIREMYRLIYRLPPLERSLILFWLDEKSYQEIADITGLTVSHVGIKIKRTKEKLVQMSNQ
ncbi:MAG: sigma-70 family RNA polymerase sigma factor [Tannerella sp.]|jgi:RNA polymerase sigma-70 factor (ECF subfamily)|nr:sigma-70 family RNA polymerase sigma factor [Tannerella sp.]